MDDPVEGVGQNADRYRSQKLVANLARTACCQIRGCPVPTMAVRNDCPLAMAAESRYKGDV
jgi:hypothetical protein